MLQYIRKSLYCNQDDEINILNKALFHNYTSMMTPAQKEQEKRRAILILIKNEFQKMIESWSSIEKREDWSYINLKSIYDDLQNFLYWKDFLGEPYLVSIEEIEYYRKLLKETKKARADRIKNRFANN